jgi:hypothetical protein
MVLIPVNLFAWKPDKWTTQDTLLESTFILVNCIDTLQTFYFLEQPGHREANSFLGHYPTRKNIIVYDLICNTLHIGISYILPSTIAIKNIKFHPRTIWQSIWIGVQGKVIHSNYRTMGGFHLKF